MAYFNGKRVLFSPTVNISEAQGVPNIPETTTTWAGLFDLANGVYIVPERTENKIFFPDTFIVPEKEVKGLIEIQGGKIYFYRAEVFAEKNADNSVFWQVKKLLDEYVDLDEFIDSGATDGIYYTQMAVPIPNDAQGRNLYGLFELVRDNIDSKGQIISYYWGLEITWNAEATAPRSFTVKNISGIGKQDIMQYTEMPEASEAYSDKIVQYVGKTAGSYTLGYFYQCRGSASSYRWYPIVVSKDFEKMDKPSSTSSIPRLVTFSLTDGTGIKKIDTSISSDSTDDGIPTSKAVSQHVQNSVSKKVDKVEGKGLSTNDYTNEERDSLNKLSKKFELVEQFTLTEDVNQIYRNQKPNGEAYNFNDVIMTVNIPIIESGSAETYGGTFMYIVNSETDISNNRVVAQGGAFKKGQVSNISVRAKIEGGIVFGSYGASAGNISNKQAAFTSYSNMNMLSAENITSVLFSFFGQPIFSGTTIKIYAR